MDRGRGDSEASEAGRAVAGVDRAMSLGLCWIEKGLQD